MTGGRKPEEVRRTGGADAVNRLREVMARLRDPRNGCPWDLEQTFASLARHTIEEAYEVAETVHRNDMDELCDELGDLLFQVIFYARIAEEQGAFDFFDVTECVTEKLIRRHPHVFGDATVSSAAEQTEAWERLKAAERDAMAAARGYEHPSILDGVSKALPALTRARKIQGRAARAGFDWSDLDGVFAKVREEIGELQCELRHSSPSKARIEDELGDLLFSCVNLARHLGTDPEEALRSANGRFAKRFRHMEYALRLQGLTPDVASPLVLEALWENAKRESSE